MTEEQIKQKAEAEADKVIIGSGMDRASVIHLKHLLVTMYMQGATEVTKELEKENTELKADNDARKFSMAMSEKVEKQLREENTELRKVAEFQQSSNMNTHLENKKIKEVLAVGSMWNKHLNSQNKALEEERDKYRDMTFDQREQLTEAKHHIKKLLDCLKQDTNDPQTNYYVCQYMDKAEQFLKSEVEK